MIGDVVIVRPNERLPAGVFVIKGLIAINQAPVTGEIIPIDNELVADVEAALATKRLCTA